jgi:hypothetical protein
LVLEQVLPGKKARPPLPRKPLNLKVLMPKRLMT